MPFLLLWVLYELSKSLIINIITKITCFYRLFGGRSSVFKVVFKVLFMLFWGILTCIFNPKKVHPRVHPRLHPMQNNRFFFGFKHLANRHKKSPINGLVWFVLLLYVCGLKRLFLWR